MNDTLSPLIHLIDNDEAVRNSLAMVESAQKNPAVGVGGAPGGHLNEQCALAALDKVKDLLK